MLKKKFVFKIVLYNMRNNNSINFNKYNSIELT